MRIFAIAVLLSLSPFGLRQANPPASQASKQLLAVRGEVVKKTAASKGWLRLTIRPPRDYPEVSVMARENDLVGNAVNRSKDTSLLGLLSESDSPDNTITAAEIEEGDIVSAIYDPQAQNRALEIYLH